MHKSKTKDSDGKPQARRSPSAMPLTEGCAPKGPGELYERLRSPKVAVRAQAARDLSAHPQLGSLWPLLQACADTSEEVREEAGRAIATIIESHGPAGIETLKKMVRNIEPHDLQTIEDALAPLSPEAAAVLDRAIKDYFEEAFHQ